MTAQKIVDYRTAARAVHLGRRSRRDPGDRAGADRQPPRARDRRDASVLAPAHVLAGVARGSGSRSRTSAGSTRLALAALGARRRRRSSSSTAPAARLALLAVAARARSAGGGGAPASTRSTAARCSAEVGRAGRATVVVTAPPVGASSTLRAQGDARTFDGRPIDEPVQLELHARPLAAAGRGPRRARRREAAAGPEHGFDERTWLRRHGVHVVLRVDEWTQVGARGGLGGVADRLRARLARSIAPGLAGERRAVLEGIVLGDGSALSPGLRQDFQASGLYHILAVSGQNVVLVAAGALTLAWLLGVSRWIGELGALAGIGAYVLAVGPQPSVIRAGIAGGARLARVAERPAARRVAGAARRARSRCSPGTRTTSTTRASSSRSPRWRRSSRSCRGSTGGSSSCRCRAAADGRRGLARLQPRHRADRVAAVRLPAAPRRAGERARRAGDAGPARARVRRPPALDAVAPGAAAGRRLAERLDGRLHRVLRPSDRLAAVRRDHDARGASRRSPASLLARRLCLAAMADELKAAYLIAGTDRPKIDRAVERLRGALRAPTRSRSTRAGELSGADAVAACNALGLFADDGPADRRRGRRGVEGRRRQGGRRLPEGAGPGDDARARRRRAEEGRADREGGRTPGRASSCSGTSRSGRSRSGSPSSSALHGTKAEPEACRALLELVGDDVYDLSSEIDKLATWAAGDPVTAADVERLVAARAETTNFALTDAWGARDVVGVLHASGGPARALGRSALEDDPARRRHPHEPRRPDPPRAGARGAGHRREGRRGDAQAASVLRRQALRAGPELHRRGAARGHRPARASSTTRSRAARAWPATSSSSAR